MADYYTVEFRVYGRDIELDSISKMLGLRPTTTQIKGQKAYLNKKFEENMWGYAPMEGDGFREWKSLNEGLVNLLDEIWPRRDAVKQLRQFSEILIWCGHFHESFGAGPEIESSVLKRLGDMGLGLVISTYFSQENSSEPAR